MGTERQRDWMWYARQVGPSLVSALFGVAVFIWFLQKSEELVPESSQRLGGFVWLMLAVVGLNLAKVVLKTVRIVRADRSRESGVDSTTRFDWDDQAGSFD